MEEWRGVSSVEQETEMDFLMRIVEVNWVVGIATSSRGLLGRKVNKTGK